MVGDEDADVAKLQSPNDALDVLHGYGVHAREGLVEHDKLRVDGQAACYLRASPLASRESVSQVLAHLLQAKLLDEALHLCDLLVVGELGALQHGHDVVLDAHLAKHACLLRQVADASMGVLIDRVVRDFRVAEIDMAVVGHYQSCRHVERRGLAGSVGSQQSYNLSLADVEVDVAHHGSLAIPLHQTLGVEHGPLLGCTFALGLLAANRCCHQSLAIVVAHIRCIHFWIAKVRKKMLISPVKDKNYPCGCSF